MFRLVPVIDCSAVTHDFAWAGGPRAAEWIALGPECPDDEVGAVVAALASYNAGCRAGTMAEASAAAEACEHLILPGGLMAATEELSIPPSCCCGLETWREWFAVAPGGPSPWLGHDPWPFVETCPDRALIWADEKTGTTPFISATYGEIERARETAQSSLAGFAGRLTDWLLRNAPAHTGLANRFRSEFEIG